MGNFYLSCFEIANPIYTIIRFGLQECGDFTWRVSDCEELVGVTHRRWWGWFWWIL